MTTLESAPAMGWRQTVTFGPDRQQRILECSFHVDVETPVCRINALLDRTSRALDRQIAYYDLWMGPFIGLSMQFRNPLRPPNEAPFPPLRSAIEDQLGLKLKPAKGTVETIVIDHAEKSPIDN